MTSNSPAKKRSLRRKPKNPEGVMSVVEHLQELRKRFLRALAAIAVGTIIGYAWYQVSFSIGTFRVHSLGEILKGPYCSLDPSMRFGAQPGDECRLLAIAPFEMFMLRLKVGALAGLVLSSPIWLYQIWAFITPGLVSKEKRNTFVAVSAAVVLFTSGAVLAYVVVSYGLEFLLGIGREAQEAALTGNLYFNFLLSLIVIFGVSFLIPLFMVMLNIAGVLQYETLKGKRRITILCIFIFAAFMTPGQDPVTMSVMAVSLCLLMEIAMQICRFNDRRKKKKQPDWMNLDDEEASGPVEAPEAIAQGTQVSGPTHVRRATPVTDFDDVL